MGSSYWRNNPVVKPLKEANRYQPIKTPEKQSQTWVDPKNGVALATRTSVKEKIGKR